MLEPDATEKYGTGYQRHSSEQQRNSSQTRPPNLSIPKNRSTGNLLAYDARAAERGRIRFSFDAGLAPAEFDAMSRSPVMTEHEHGLGVSGLRRIRQQPPPRAPTLPSTENSSRNTSVPPRASSLTIQLPSKSRQSSSGALTPGPTSPGANFTEDLTRFPSESLHSFSFAQQSEEFIHNRHNVLKRSIEFMKDRLGWAASSPGIASAQARLTGDQEMQTMLDLLARANLVGSEGVGSRGLVQGPWTGPAEMEGEGNVFDRSFLPRSSSPDIYASPISSPLMQKKPLELPEVPEDGIPSQKKDEGLGLEVPGVSLEVSSRTTTDESRTTANTLTPQTRRQSLKRTYTDTSHMTLQNKLMDAMSMPYIARESSGSYSENILSPTMSIPSSFVNPSFMGSSSSGVTGPHHSGPAVHGHASRWAPAAQAIFTTESTEPWTILAANDLACLVFGVTKSEVRKMGIMEVVREERRAWLQEKLAMPGSEAEHKPKSTPATQSHENSPSSSTSFLLGRAGVTAQLLSKPPSRSVTHASKKVKTYDGAGSSIAAAKQQAAKPTLNHPSHGSRGVLLCGDVVPIQKRNGHKGSASLWVKEKRSGLIWVLEEIHEDVATLSLDDDGLLTGIEGSAGPIWGDEYCKCGIDVGELIPRIPRQGIDPRTGEIDYAEVTKRKYFTACNNGRINIPAAIEKVQGKLELRVSSFPHIAGIIVLNASNLLITSSNTVFSAALFGHEQPDGLSICDLVPDFDRVLEILTDEDGIRLVDGIVIPEHSFRRARAFLALREGKEGAAQYFLRPDGLPAKHKDGSEIKIDVQMRVVKSDKHTPTHDEHVIVEEDESDKIPESQSQVVYALWITYSRHLHASRQTLGTESPRLLSGAQTPLHQPSPGQTQDQSPVDMDSDEPARETSHASLLTKQLKEVAIRTVAKVTGKEMSSKDITKEISASKIVEPIHKKVIGDFVILEDLGQGAYGQVKLARNKESGSKVVIKYVTKKRILVDTWTRDRRLGTVPLEIHVLDYLRRDGLKHPGIVVMADFWEDDVNYYIEMIPHGLPGMDLFDYIELRVSMQEHECRSIFVQVAAAIHHLHTKALVVHRDIKDENVVLDGEGQIKLIDFGSAAYIKSGPFEVFVGTIDYAAPEVLQGKQYTGLQQDVWALGILLYTIVYKENPFYSIDEIMDHDLRVPYIMSESSIDLIRCCLERDVEKRIGIEDVLAHDFCRDPVVVDQG